MNAFGSKQARDCCKELGTEIVQLVVGSDSKIFSVHKKLLCSVSDFFDKALNGRFAEASSNQMDLPENIPSILSMFISWLYTRDLIFDMYSCDVNSEVTTLIDLYVFADAKQCNALKNEVMDTLQDGLYRGELFLCLHHVQLVFEKTCTNEDAPIRCFLVAAIAHGVHKKFWEVDDLSNLFRSHQGCCQVSYSSKCTDQFPNCTQLIFTIEVVQRNSLYVPFRCMQKAKSALLKSCGDRRTAHEVAIIELMNEELLGHQIWTFGERGNITVSSS